VIALREKKKERESSMKKTARLIVTYNCNRSCPGCCNTHGNTVRKIENIEELLGYEEIILTGGEPMLLGFKLLDFIYRIHDLKFKGNIYLYTAYWNDANMNYRELLQLVDGITFTIHAEANDKDIISLKRLSEYSRLRESNFSSRLIIDSRVYEKYDLSNIELTNWDVIRKLQWKDYCEPAPNEDLVEFLL
jgi:organic radical activating enzyme